MTKPYTCVEEPIVTSFTLGRADKARLVAKATADGRSVSAEIRIAVREHLATTKERDGARA